MAKLLPNLTILEASAFLASPYAGLILSQLSATVIHIDPNPGRLAKNGGQLTSDGESLYWASLNKGKKSIIIDLRAPEAQELVQKLINKPSKSNGLPV